MSGVRIGSVYYDDRYFGDDTTRVMSPTQIEDLDLLVFWGGGDISTRFYGEPNVHSQEPNHHRDSVEEEVMKAALGKIPILGICRGAQLACVQLGGRLYQHVDNHGTTHHMVISEPYLRFADASRIITSSLHHQMMRPPADCEMIAVTPGLSTRRLTSVKEEVGPHDDPEVLVHTDKKVLMVQGHPEYTSWNSQLTRFTRNLVKHFFGVTL